MKRVLSFLPRRARLHLFLMLVPMLVSAVLEIFSIGMALPLIATFFGNPGTQNRMISRFLMLFEGVDRDRLTIIAPIVFVGLLVLRNVVYVATMYAINLFTQLKQAQFRQEMFDLYLRRPYAIHVLRNTSEILRNLYTSTGSVFQALLLILNVVFEGLMVLSICVFLFTVDPAVTVIVGIALLVVGLVYYRGMAPTFRRWGRETHALEAKIIKSINQGFGAIKDIKILNVYDYVNRAFAAETDRMAILQCRNTTAQSLPRSMVEIVATLLLLGMAASLLRSSGSTQEVMYLLGLYFMAALRLMPSVNRVLGHSMMLKNLTAPIDTLYRDWMEGLKDREDTDDAASGVRLPLDREIRLERVSYAFASEGRSGNVLRGVDFSISKGEAIGVVGASGAGKTTLINVIMGLLRPTEGRLLIDGVDAFAHRSAWQRQLGYVPQDIYLLDDTLKRNITLGVDDDAVDAARVATALHLAHMDEMVAALPNGLDTLVGERGARISGGQRQRIGIARALYHDPDVLVFDEATSSLDNETEREILSAIEELVGLKTLIIVAHRISTVRVCNRLIYMKDGRVEDIGGFQELIDRNADFRHMIRLYDGGTIAVSS